MRTEGVAGPTVSAGVAGVAVASSSVGVDGGEGGVVEEVALELATVIRDAPSDTGDSQSVTSDAYP